MNGIINLGKYIFAIPFAVFGAFHFMNADAMAGIPPFGGKAMVYITGVALVAAAVSIIIGKLDKLASLLLGLMLLIFVFAVWMPGASGGDQTATSMLLKDLALAGGAIMYAGMAKDNSVVG